MHTYTHTHIHTHTHTHTQTKAEVVDKFWNKSKLLSCEGVQLVDGIYSDDEDCFMLNREDEPTRTLVVLIYIDHLVLCETESELYV
jgi:hypothetical protein